MTINNAFLSSLSSPDEPLLWCSLLAASCFQLYQQRPFQYPPPLEWIGAFLLCAMACHAWFLRPSTASAARRNAQEDEAPVRQLWREPTKPASDASGVFLGLLLTPLLCLAVARNTAAERADLWQLYAILVSVLGYGAWAGAEARKNLGLCAYFVMMGFVVEAGSSTAVALSVLLVAWMAVFYSLDNVLPTCFYGVFTRGEWMAVASLFSIGLTEYACLSLNSNSSGREPNHATVAMAGLLSVLVTCPIMEVVKKIPFAKAILRKQQQAGPDDNNNNSNQEELLTLLFQLPFWIGIPLLGVEGLEFYWLRNPSASSLLPTELQNILPIPVQFLPKSLLWLVGFLMETETPLVQTNFLPQIPRYGWLGYWLLVLLATIPFSPQPSGGEETTIATTTVVLMRKWFHLIAVLLFGPVTLAAPQLLSLAYAIAWAILVLLESARTTLPMIAQFHQRYLDPSKEEGDNGKLVVSHMALVVGCGLPLWIAELVDLPQQQPQVPILLLPLWGVLCLGIGDAMGAVVGVCLGKTKWSQHNSRTLEGSLAVWVSLVASCGAVCRLLGEEFWWPCLWTITFVTLLEAHTFQVDNLVLPLAGAASLLWTVSQ